MISAVKKKMKINTTTQSIKSRLSKIIEESDKSQAEIARKIGTTPAMVSRWKKGSVIPTTKSYEKLCKLLGIDINWLLTGISSNDKYKTNPTVGGSNHNVHSDQKEASEMLYKEKYFQLMEKHFSTIEKHDVAIKSKDSRILDLENMLAKSKTPATKKHG